jgi:tRNA threonylcarbamoyladenosine modification (KEOPS) complex Cgi121 subunit
MRIDFAERFGHLVAQQYLIAKRERSRRQCWFCHIVSPYVGGRRYLASAIISSTVHAIRQHPVKTAASRTYSADLAGGGVFPAALSSAMICCRHSMP